MSDVCLKVLKNGPVLVDGDVSLLDSEGKPIAISKKPFALCRCGDSANKPFCDGSHSRVGFDETKSTHSKD